jgi:DNA-binding Lrp family transcriptional regulator
MIEMIENNGYAVRYVAIKAKPGKMHDNKIFSYLSKINEIDEIHMLYGDYNLLVKVKAETPEKAKKISDMIGELEAVLEIKSMSGLKV